MKAVTLVITTEGSQWWDSAALTWAEFLRWLRWLGECDLMEPLEEEVILLMLHMLDLRDPIELGELGGECWKQKQNNSGYLWLDVKLSTSFDGSESKTFLNIQVYDKVLLKLEIMQGQVWNNKWHLFYKCKMNNIYGDILVRSSTHYCYQIPLHPWWPVRWPEAGCGGHYTAYTGAPWSPVGAWSLSANSPHGPSIQIHYLKTSTSILAMTKIHIQMSTQVSNQLLM